MDVVHHTCIGGAVCLTAVAYNQDLAGISFLAASVFPDLDVILMLFGKRFYLKNHQAVTHSFILAPVYAILISSLLSYILLVDFGWALLLGALGGLILHITLDWFNTFRISLLLPVTSKRYSLDAVFFVDSVAWGLTGLFFFFYLFMQFEPVLILYPIAFTSYFIGKLILHRHIAKTLKPLHAIPSSFNPFEFYILDNTGENLEGYLYHALRKSIRKRIRYASIEEKHLKLADRSPIFHDMKKIFRAFRITKVSSNEDGTTIQAGDIAVRNFGGCFGKTVLKFDKNDRLVHEVANI